MGTVTDPAKLCDLFLRRSTLQDDKTTLHAHERDLRERAVREGLTVRKVWKEELSAFKAGVKREEFDSAITAVLAGQVRHLLVWKLDRLSRRGMGQVGQVLDQFDSKGARLLAHMDGLNSSIPTSGTLRLAGGAGALGVVQHIDAHAPNQGGEEVHGCLAGRAASVRAPRTQGQDGHGAPSQGVRHLRRIADGLLADKAAGTIADELNAEGLTTRRGGRWR